RPPACESGSLSARADQHQWFLPASWYQWVRSRIGVVTPRRACDSLCGTGKQEGKRWLLVPTHTARADADNGTTKFPTFLTGLPETAASRPLFSSFPAFPQVSIPAESLQIVHKERFRRSGFVPVRETRSSSSRKTVRARTGSVGSALSWVSRF